MRGGGVKVERNGGGGAAVLGRTPVADARFFVRAYHLSKKKSQERSWGLDEDEQKEAEALYQRLCVEHEVADLEWKV